LKTAGKSYRQLADPPNAPMLPQAGPAIGLTAFAFPGQDL
jgi:hypothetical protein